jgi:hypothetical protein
MAYFGNVNIAHIPESHRKPVIFLCKSVIVLAARLIISITSDKNYLFCALSKILLTRCQFICWLMYIALAVLLSQFTSKLMLSTKKSYLQNLQSSIIYGNFYFTSSKPIQVEDLFSCRESEKSPY